MNGIYMPSLEVESRRPWKDELVVIAAIYLVQSPTYWGKRVKPEGTQPGSYSREKQSQGSAQMSSPF